MRLHSIFCYSRLSVATTGKLIHHKLWRYLAVVLLKHCNACSHLPSKLMYSPATHQLQSGIGVTQAVERALCVATNSVKQPAVS